jgi:dihydrofolate reductase
MNRTYLARLLVALFCLLPAASALPRSLLHEWDDVAQILPHLVLPQVASELKAEFENGFLVELSPEQIRVASDLNLIHLLKSIVFLRHKVGLEALDDPSCGASYLNIEHSRPIYNLARKLTGAMLVSQQLTPLHKEALLAKVSALQFGNDWVHGLWMRFYDEHGNRRHRHQFPVLSVAYMKSNRGIGYKGQLPWGQSMPTDFDRFLRAACGHVGIMGRLTFHDRRRATENIVVSSNPNFKAEDCLVASSIEEAMLLASADPAPAIYGGARIYGEALQSGYAYRVLLTEIDASRPADAFFPNFNPHGYRLVEDTGIITDAVSAYPFRFLTYDRGDDTYSFID